MPSVVSCLLMNEDGEILILKRSDKVKTYKDCWSAITGYVEENEEPINTAYKEIREEVGLEKKDIFLLKEGKPIVFTDFYNEKRFEWIVHPFLFKTLNKGKIQIDWEHTNYSWIKPDEIVKFRTVPRLKNVVLGLFK